MEASGFAGSSGLLYVFYPPVVAYIAYLGIRFRSWTLFTAANPAIPAGGFVGESKHQILDHLKDAAPWLPCSTLLACGVPRERVAEAEEFMRQHGLRVSGRIEAGCRAAWFGGGDRPFAGTVVRVSDALVVPGDLARVCPR